MNEAKLAEFLRLYKLTRNHWRRDRCVCVLCVKFMKLGDDLILA